ncbi:response regulator transcription factor [Ornithinimicrobium cryptoxanthini]|uniref:LuxR C-terminal-related transcriptional regulator n=1 Tax=Ornithinimicrobium cryptoxanthini TaxID=2934161 RepID=A0ABY4YGW0_9MICO|nr:LuxR C-terminal-related transcriptional regulator [Ornithinimicrobium cryptoxanthini]USQ76006.1 LuxR C-terminal-related transcriptional regulator [Ornithinimicrobium cryptoxanthini]
MSDKSLTSRDHAVLRDILELARSDHPETPQERTFQTLAHLEALLGCVACLQEMDSLHRTRTYGQATIEGERWIETPKDSAPAVEDPWAEEFWRQWWGGMCSLPERIGGPVVVVESFVYSQRELRANPLREWKAWTDEILVGYPTVPGRSARFLLRREEPSVFGFRELTLMEMLMPHLAGLAVATVTPSQPLSGLTRRETDILRHVARGLTNRQVGRALGISEGTVRKHLEHTYPKLGVLSRTGAVAAVSQDSSTD